MNERQISVRAIRAPHRGAVDRRLATALVALTVVAMSPAGASAARPQADLVVTKARKPPASVVVGGLVPSGGTLENRGRRTARRSQTGYYLSPTRAKSKRSIRLGRRGVPKLAPGKSSSSRIQLRLPASVGAGSYHLIVCADDTAQVREADERNNCRAAGSTKVRPRPGSTLTDPVNPSIDPRPTGPGAGPADPGPADPGPIDPGPADPGTPARRPARSVTPVLHSAGAVTKRLGGDTGGWLEVTTPDGDKVTLMMPAGTLLADEDITMTPVASVGGLPFSGGLRGAVQLEPDGLRLQNPALLIVEPATPLPAAELSPFSWVGEGANFHLHPTSRELSRFELPLLHFSGAGLASGTKSERDEQREHDGGSDEADAEQALQWRNEEWRDCELGGGGDCDNERSEAFRQAKALLLTKLPNVRAKLEAARSNDEAIPEATQGAADWIKMVELLGFDDELGQAAEQLKQLIRDVVRAAYDRAAAECRAGDFSAFERMASLARQAILIGAMAETDLGGLERECTIDFQMSFRSNFNWESFNSEGDRFWEELTAHTDGVTFRASPLRTTPGASPLLDMTYDHYLLAPSQTFVNENCRVAVSQFNVRPSNLRKGGGSSPPRLRVRLRFPSFLCAAIVTDRSPDPPMREAVHPLGDRWLWYHAGEWTGGDPRFGGDFGFAIEGWSGGPGSWSKTYSRTLPQISNPAATIDEATSLTITRVGP